MTGTLALTNAGPDSARAQELFRKHERSIYERTDRLFAGLMVVQWIAGIAAAYWISPRAWSGIYSRTHLHLWSALYLGGLITLLPVILALTRPGRTSTRYVIATTQMLMSSLLIHFTGGRIETHFHVFGSLAFLSFYRDWRVLVPATVVVAADHFLRGVFWPQSVYGVLTASSWRWLEHAGWVIFEDVFLVLSCLRGKEEMRSIAERTAALHGSEERYRAIVERAEGMFLAEAGSKRVLECNAAFQHLLGYSSEEAAGLSIYDFDPDSHEAVDRTIRTFVEQKQPITLERPYRRKDGTLIEVTLNLSLLASGSGHVLCGAVRDVTDHRRAEATLKQTAEQLRQAYKMEAVGQLAGGIAHDFNNLLTAILGYVSEIVKNELGENHPLAGDVMEITRAGETASSLTRQLLAFSRRQVLQPAILSVNSVVSDVDKMLRRLIGEHIDLVLDLAPDLCGE